MHSHIVVDTYGLDNRVQMVMDIYQRDIVPMENVLTTGVSLQNRIEYSIITLQGSSFLNSFGFLYLFILYGSPL